MKPANVKEENCKLLCWKTHNHAQPFVLHSFDTLCMNYELPEMFLFISCSDTCYVLHAVKN